MIHAKRQPPNERLQRTRSAPLRSPLSRKPLGALSRKSLLIGSWWRVVIAALTIQALGLPFNAAGTPTGDDTTQAVRYTLSDGFDLRAVVILKADVTFEFSWDGCQGPIARAAGTYAADGREVSLRAHPSGFARDPRTFSDSMVRVPWGEREYLIPRVRMLAFVNAINAGHEPRTQEMGVFYLRAGDEMRPAAGQPALPLEWLAFLLPAPVTGTVVRVLQRETASQRPVVIVGAGADSGLKAGMKLYATNRRRPHFRGYLTILEVAATTAKAVVTFQYNHIRIGDSWSTRSTDGSGLREL